MARIGRLWSLVGIPIAAGLVAGDPARAEDAMRGSLAIEVIGSEEATPGGTVMFRIDVRGATPGVTVALPVPNLPVADPDAPDENRMACMLLTDDQGYASLILETRVSTRPTPPGSDATTRSVAALEDVATIGVGPVASAEIKLIDHRR